MFKLKNTRHVRLTVTVAAAALLSGGAGILFSAGGDAPQEKDASGYNAWVEERGTTQYLTEQALDASRVLARERPTKLPPLMELTDTCREAAEPLRKFMADNPYGAQLESSKFETFNKLLSAVSGEACSEGESRNLTIQEVDPWLSWYKIPAKEKK